MNKILIFLPLIFLFTFFGGLLGYQTYYESHVGAPPDGEPESSVPTTDQPWWLTWERPEVPAKVGIQIGHLNTEDHPDELEKLRKNYGASGGDYTEAQVNQAVAEELASLLKAEGVEVDLIPARVEPDYWADVFIAIHADGSPDPYKSGYKISGPWRDLSGEGDALVESLNQYYGEITGLEYDPNVTRNMRGYYAFAWWRYHHSIHPMTTAVIAETGFLTSSYDREVIAEQPALVAKALAKPILDYLNSKDLL